MLNVLVFVMNLIIMLFYMYFCRNDIMTCDYTFFWNGEIPISNTNIHYVDGKLKLFVTKSNMDLNELKTSYVLGLELIRQ